MKVVQNRAIKEKEDSIAQQKKLYDLYNANVDRAVEMVDIDLKRDINTNRKILSIMDEMQVPKGGSIYQIIFVNTKIEEGKKTKIIHNALALYEDERKKIIKLAAGDVKLSDLQEVALCGAIFRLCVSLPAVLAINGNGIRK